MASFSCARCVNAQLRKSFFYIFSFRDSTIDYLRIEEVTEAAEGTYKCFARNTEGVDFDTTFLDVEGACCSTIT